LVKLIILTFFQIYYLNKIEPLVYFSAIMGATAVGFTSTHNQGLANLLEDALN
jgi:hypothetical protein